MPPADPFEHLRCLPKVHKKPRYTYRRRSGNRSCESGNSSDGSDYSAISIGSKRKASVDRGCSRSGSRQLTRSASLGSISDSEAAARQDPALWLTTPRKRPRHRMPPSGPAAASATTAKALLHESQNRPFSQRLERLISKRPMQPVNAGKARGLQSLMVHLGETLWLGRLSTPQDAGASARILPLKVYSAFQLGEAIACSDGSDDLDYIDEIYSAIPPFITRFVLWQHAVALCYLRTPAYADVLAESLWQVGAFKQQEWLIGARLAGIGTFADLVNPANVAPLHLRAIDIGSESRFMQAMLGRLTEERRKLAADSADMYTLATGSLWYQFVPAADVSAGIKRPASSVDISSGGESGDETSGSCKRERAPMRSHHMDAVVPSRYAKWVARIGDVKHGALMLAEALDQALCFVTRGIDGAGNVDTEDMAALLYLAVDGARCICSLLLTKLSCAASDTRLLRQSLDMVVSGGVWRSINVLAAFAGNASDKASVPARADAWADVRQEAHAVCNTYRLGLALLALRHLRICTSGVADNELCWQVSRAKTELTRLSRAELRRICDAAKRALEQDLAGGRSRRSMLAAHFTSLIASAFSATARQQPDSPLGSLVLDSAVMPLAVAGASPGLFLEMARLVGETLRCSKVAMAIVDLVVPRFDAIWDHHDECRSWQMDWTRLQMAWGTGADVARQADEAADASSGSGSGSCESAGNDSFCGDERSRARVLQQLVDLADELERRRLQRTGASAAAQPSSRAAKTGMGAWASSGSACAPAAKASVAKVKEDELGLVFLGNRRRSRTKQ
ncbi:hypothetical protein LPJ56_001590 [Coemansia sp. RSA 2599]|nr:hypothetical protein LPJ56_001590 [Coemansia sp. RSA 2599]